MTRRAPEPELFAPPARPVKREKAKVWQAVVKLRQQHLALFEGEYYGLRLQGPVTTVYRLSRNTHVVDGKQVTTRELIRMAGL